MLALTCKELQTAKRFSFLFAFLLIFFTVIKSEVVFSSKQSEGKRDVDKNIIIDYFNREVMLKGWRRKNIFVVEDLDRSQDAAIVRNFLKEIRRYYLSDKNCLQRLHANRVIFIVCIKPEALLQEMDKTTNSSGFEDETTTDKKELFYSKVFDYVINLNPVNIDNMEPILDGLLEEISDNLIKLNLITSSENAKVEKISGMSWMIRGKKVGIREVKERLNIGLSLYENLKTKFSDKDISFEKCAIVVYLMKEYPYDYYKLEDRSIEQLFERYLSGELSEENVLNKSFSKDFRNEIFELIRNKKIDSTYRTYFYNYPQKSRLYNVYEMNVYNSIVYCEKPNLKEEYEKWLLDVDEEVIVDALSKLKQLDILFPLFVLDFEKIGNIVVTQFGSELLNMIDQVPLDHVNMKRSTQVYITLLKKYFAREGFSDLLDAIGNIIINNSKW